MADFEDFFSDVNPEEMREQAVLPDIAITEPLGNILPNTMLYPQTVKYAGVYAVDRATNLLYLNTKAEVGNTEKNPNSISGNVLPLVRILTVVEDDLIDGFIVDGRNTAALSSVSKEEVEAENERADSQPEYLASMSPGRFYVPALAVLFETADRKLGINGDQRLKGFGLGLVLEVNKFLAKNARSFDPKLEGTYAITAESEAESVPDIATSSADTKQYPNPPKKFSRFFKK